MSEFTKDMAEDDSVFKSELHGSIGQAASRNFPELYDYFRQACEADTGAPPYIVLSDMLIKALNDEAYAEQIRMAEIDISDIKRAENREDDLEYALKLYDKLDNFDDSGIGIDIDSLIEKKVNMSADPLGGLTEGLGGEKEDKLANAINNLNNRLDRIEGEVQDGDVDREGISDVDEEVDDLFDDSSGDPVTEEDGTNE